MFFSLDGIDTTPDLGPALEERNFRKAFLNYLTARRLQVTSDMGKPQVHRLPGNLTGAPNPIRIL